MMGWKVYSDSEFCKNVAEAAGLTDFVTEFDFSEQGMQSNTGMSSRCGGGVMLPYIILESDTEHGVAYAKRKINPLTMETKPFGKKNARFKQHGPLH